MAYRFLIGVLPIPFVIFLWSDVEQLDVISVPIKTILSVVAALLVVVMFMDDEILGESKEIDD